MPAFRYEFYPVKKLAKSTLIPRSLFDFPQIIAEKQARKIWGRGFNIDAENEKNLNFLTSL